VVQQQTVCLVAADPTIGRRRGGESTTKETKHTDGKQVGEKLSGLLAPLLIILLDHSFCLLMKKGVGI
jgi:hypothetical protein